MLRTNVIADSNAASLRNGTRARRIGFLAFPDAESVDICGPLGVFANADYQLRALGRTGDRGYEVLVIAAAAGPVRTQSGLQIVATHGCTEDTQQLDTLMVAGGLASRQPATIL